MFHNVVFGGPNVIANATDFVRIPTKSCLLLYPETAILPADFFKNPIFLHKTSSKVGKYFLRGSDFSKLDSLSLKSKHCSYRPRITLEVLLFYL